MNQAVNDLGNLITYKGEKFKVNYYSDDHSIWIFKAHSDLYVYINKCPELYDAAKTYWTDNGPYSDLTLQEFIDKVLG